MSWQYLKLYLRMDCLEGIDTLSTPPWTVSDEGSADWQLGLRALVAESLAAPKLPRDAATSYSDLLQTTQFGDPLLPIRWHAERIAHLMRHGWGDSIQIECFSKGVFVEDGNHRFAAAMLLKHENIFVDVRGPTDALARHGMLHENEVQASDLVQTSDNEQTVWVHAMDGSTVGRFDWRFGIDVHSTVTDQLAGRSQCLHCTHAPPTQSDWEEFRQLMWRHHGAYVPENLHDAEPVEALVEANAP